MKEMKPELKEIVVTESTPMRWENISLFCQIISICLLFMLIKGSSSFDSILGFPKCGWESQLTVLALIVVCYFYTRAIFKKQRTSDIRK